MIVTDTIRRRAAALRGMSNIEFAAAMKDEGEFSILCKMIRTVAGCIAEVPAGEDPAIVPVEEPVVAKGAKRGASIEVPVDEAKAK